MQAIEYIEQIEKIDILIENKLGESARWREKAKSLGGFTSAERVTESKDPHKAGDVVAKYLDIEAEVDELKAKKKRIIKTIERLPTNEYVVAYKYYIQHVPLKEIAVDKKMSYSWAVKTKSAAMKHLQIILDGERV